MMTIKSADLVGIARLAYAADIPVMLHGSPGIGKSEGLEQAAEALGIGCTVIDLTTVEPTDLSGMPYIVDGRTRLAAASFFPDEPALLVFEELNRCSRWVRAPALQLLTARRAGEHRLAKGVLPMAAVNDAEDGHEADILDPALLSRFLHVYVVSDVPGWCKYAEGEGYDPRLVEFVRSSPDLFPAGLPQVEHAFSNPRSWTYADRFLKAWQASPERNDRDLAVGMSGLVGETHAAALLRVLLGGVSGIAPTDILDDYVAVRARVKEMVREKRLDALRSVWLGLRDRIVATSFDPAADPARMQNLDTFIRDLPAELRREANAWLKAAGWAA